MYISFSLSQIFVKSTTLHPAYKTAARVQTLIEESLRGTTPERISNCLFF